LNTQITAQGRLDATRYLTLYVPNTRYLQNTGCNTKYKTVVMTRAKNHVLLNALLVVVAVLLRSHMVDTGTNMMVHIDFNDVNCLKLSI
jgi:hypothetical protein